MNQHEAPTGMVATLGHPANQILIVKTNQGTWRYVDTGDQVDDVDFRGGWDPWSAPVGHVMTEDDQLAYIKEYISRGCVCLLSEDQIMWLVGEVERLREHIAELEDTPASPAIRPRL